MRSFLQKKPKRSSLLVTYADMLGSVMLKKRATLAERARRIEAERINAVKSQFIANMSHELRTPLNSIIGFSKMMTEAERHHITTEKMIEYSGYIHETAEHLLDIINDLLDISKIQSGTQTLDPEEVLISEVLLSCMTLVKIAAHDNQITLSDNISEHLPLIMGEPMKLKQIFANLLSNAVKFTPNGGRVNIIAERLNEKEIEILVEDTGPGMTLEEIEIAMLPFGQVENSLDRKNGGTGLGLPIAKALVELHGGLFQMRSEKGVGTSVSVILPTGESFSASLKQKRRYVVSSAKNAG